ncbi:hypothetical protein [Bacillus sp. FJAT-29814]|uniref:hypothetical protein n=1 Tax=Bacillus sp. FJAT-29814 TaxID=1729688 RepID=UPI0008305BB1|nr:hypothetical protein [Bacillus sp. FJAT-29814]
MSDNELVMEMELVIDYIVKEISVSNEIVERVLDSELDFLNEKGLVADAPHNIDLHESDNFVDVNELLDFVVKKTGLSPEVVQNVLEKEEEYMVKNNFMY